MASNWYRFVQFRLRTLLVFVTFFAIPLAWHASWRHSGCAEVKWLNPTSPEAMQLYPPSRIVRTEQGYQLTFYPLCRTASEICTQGMKQLEDRGEFPRQGDGVLRLDFPGVGHLVAESNDRQRMDELLSLWQQLDVSQDNGFVLRGIVVNHEGSPQQGAWVDLLGPYAEINHSRTRPDGTFFLATDAAPGDGYFLRIRSGGGNSSTLPFRLEDPRRENFMHIRLP